MDHIIIDTYLRKNPSFLMLISEPNTLKLLNDTLNVLNESTKTHSGDIVKLETKINTLAKELDSVLKLCQKTKTEVAELQKLLKSDSSKLLKTEISNHSASIKSLIAEQSAQKVIVETFKKTFQEAVQKIVVSQIALKTKLQPIKPKSTNITTFTGKLKHNLNKLSNATKKRSKK